jgi:methylation protein EvaC
VLVCGVPFGTESVMHIPKADVVVSCNTFAHIAKRSDVLRGIYRILDTNGVWIDEEPYLGEVVRQLAYDQFYNEHIYYSSVASMAKMLDRHDLEIKDVEFVWTHGGSVRYVVGHKTPGGSAKVRELIAQEGLDRLEVFMDFADEVKRFTDRFVGRVRSLRGDVAGYAASAKSTTVLNYCQLGPDDVECLYDNTIVKQGKLSPGMHVPVVDAGGFRRDKPKHTIMFAWNHAKEIMAKESSVPTEWMFPVNLKPKEDH